MKRKGIIILAAMLLVMLMGMTMAAAAENATDGVMDDNVVLADSDEMQNEYNAEIFTEDVTHEYGAEEEYGFVIQDLDGNPIDDAFPTVFIDGEEVDDDLTYCYGDGDYYFSNYCSPEVGTHRVQIKLDDGTYKAKTATMKVKITKAPTTLKLKKYVTTTKEYTVLKARAYSHGNVIYEGTVTFKINSKTYRTQIDPDTGYATKKIRLSKTKTYTYKATFKSDGFKTKTASSKVYVKKAKSYYTLKIKNTRINKVFKAKLPYKQYVKVLNAKNRGKVGCADFFTGIKRPESYGGGYYSVGLSTNDDYFTYHGYEKGDYIYLAGGGGYLQLKKINLYTYNF